MSDSVTKIEPLSNPALRRVKTLLRCRGLKMKASDAMDTVRSAIPKPFQNIRARSIIVYTMNRFAIRRLNAGGVITTYHCVYPLL
jgi:hypothetical protein